MKDIEMGEIIGRGAFGEVWKAIWHGSDVAVKKIRITAGGDQQILNEIEIMRNVRHPNLVSLLASEVDKFEANLVMEYMAKGSVYQLLQETTNKLTWEDVRKIAIDVSKVSAFCMAISLKSYIAT